MKPTSFNEDSKASRIEAAMQHYSKTTNIKMSWTSLSSAILKSPSAPTQWKKDKISNETMQDIAKFLGVSFIWLMHNQGEMIIADIIADTTPLNKSSKASRIEAAMQYYSKTQNKKLSWATLSSAIQKSASAQSKWKKDIISNETMENIAKFLGVSFIWLMHSQGEMIIADTSIAPKEIDQPVSEYKKDVLASIGALFIQWQNSNLDVANLQSQIETLATKQLHQAPSSHDRNMIIHLQSRSLEKQLKSNKIYADILEASTPLLTKNIHSD